MADSANTESPAIVFEGSAPILRVGSLLESLSYYARALGFSVDWQGTSVASVSRGNCHILLSEGDQGNQGSWVWIGVSDAGALCQELSARGANIRQPPTNYPWAYEVQVQDLDGNVLRLGSEPKENEPFGEWLDMNGRRWRRNGGGWTPLEPTS